MNVVRTDEDRAMAGTGDAGLVAWVAPVACRQSVLEAESTFSSGSGDGGCTPS